MFTSIHSRQASTYKRVNTETGVNGADPHYLIDMLYTGLLQTLLDAAGCMRRRDVPGKCQALSKAVRILEEGLQAGLNHEDGGETARHLGALYKYCVRRLTLANLNNDIAGVEEVMGFIAPVADAWKQIRGQVTTGRAGSLAPGVQ